SRIADIGQFRKIESLFELRLIYSGIDLSELPLIEKLRLLLWILILLGITQTDFKIGLIKNQHARVMNLKINSACRLQFLIPGLIQRFGMASQSIDGIRVTPGIHGGENAASGPGRCLSRGLLIQNRDRTSLFQ